MQINLEFADRHVVVFGGTTGINLGIAKAFARQHARVTVVSRKRDNVHAACEALAEYGGQVNGVCADVRDFDAVGQGLAASVAVFGDIDVLVSGAAGNFLCEAKGMSSNGFKAVIDIDLVGTFHVLRQAFAHMRKPGGVVINVTAPQSSIPMRYQAHACAAKAGIDQLTRVLALEWGQFNLRVNAISPGPIADTEGFKRLLADGDQDAAQCADNVPLKRLGEADDIANLALFLASPFASYISGAVIPCDGGGALDSVKPMLEAAGLRAMQASI
ncbi:MULTISPECIES: SDR family oxidoreductase [unclassified Burkholderia]|uniref:SDR family oxidoreductase n=1 Tax=unclassified Burkholderia TaxID=2613784 RepID=UPI000F56815B|nr:MULTISPECIES: SDR family oxidoreductase [unclassified Burkholderia]RQR30142.1 SDR family NAD(P)-dependent oxidoreductase [Burkholderia sp. Bp9142]RQR50024.1 SDR family NAD(P)-dependent oxidoreductase [Burkholderia sp. Bp9140]